MTVNHARRRVMVVDDDADFVNVARSMLEAGGYEVDVAYNGSECLEKLQASRPDLVLLDIMMSTWSEGFEVADKLRDLAPGKPVPVILVSSLDLKSDLEGTPGIQSMLPVRACLVKPVQRERLLAQVAAALRQGGGPGR